jgi:hypothetical protein
MKTPTYEELKHENEVLRQGLSRVATNIGNGSFALPEASINFLAFDVAEEVRVVINNLRAQAAKEKLIGKEYCDEHKGKFFLGCPQCKVERAERMIEGIKGEAQSYRDSHINIINWLCLHPIRFDLTQADVPKQWYNLDPASY